MTQSSVKRLHTVSDADLEAMLPWMCRAFAGDIAMAAYVGGDWTLLPSCFRAMVKATALEGEVYIVNQGPHERIVACGLWFPPGNRLFGTEAQRDLGYNDFFKTLSPEARNWYTNTIPTVAGRLRNELFTKEEQSKLWWSYLMVTDPEQQGQGHGTAIVDVVNKKALAQGNFIGLSAGTELNVRKYLAMGFRERGRAWMEAPTGDFPLVMVSRDVPHTGRATGAAVQCAVVL